MLWKKSGWGEEFTQQWRGNNSICHVEIFKHPVFTPAITPAWLKSGGGILGSVVGSERFLMGEEQFS